MSAHIPEDELVWRVAGDPQHGDVYKHGKTGRLYAVESIALDAGDPTTRLVVYRERGAYTHVWVRPLAEFVDGRFERVM